MADQTKHARMPGTTGRILGEGYGSPRKAAGVAAGPRCGRKVRKIGVCCVISSQQPDRAADVTCARPRNRARGSRQIATHGHDEIQRMAPMNRCPRAAIVLAVLQPPRAQL
jgi:hypothetical protein